MKPGRRNRSAPDSRLPSAISDSGFTIGIHLCLLRHHHLSFEIGIQNTRSLHSASVLQHLPIRFLQRACETRSRIFAAVGADTSSKLIRCWMSQQSKTDRSPADRSLSAICLLTDLLCRLTHASTNRGNNQSKQNSVVGRSPVANRLDHQRQDSRLYSVTAPIDWNHETKLSERSVSLSEHNAVWRSASVLSNRGKRFGRTFTVGVSLRTRNFQRLRETLPTWLRRNNCDDVALNSGIWQIADLTPPVVIVDSPCECLAALSFNQASFV